MDFRPIGTLPIPRPLVKELIELGFIYCEDVCVGNNEENTVFNAEVEELLRRYSSSPQEFWYSMLKYPSATTAYDLLEEENADSSIPTFSMELDKYLNGGIHLKKLSEFCGPPGSGKTQMCFQLCVDVQLPSAFGGLQGQAIYFDTSNGFCVSRLLEIGKACIDHCENIACQSQNSDMINAMKTFNERSILNNVFYSQCFSYSQLVAGVTYLKEFLKNKQVKLIIIDNITLPLKCIHDSVYRVQSLFEFTRHLRSIAETFNIAVVLTNNMTTKIEELGGSSVESSLGETFGHCTDYRFLLGYNRKDNNYVCANLKNLYKQSSSVHLKITKGGIRDC